MPLDPALAAQLTPELVEGALLSRSLRDYVRSGWHTVESQPFISAWHIDCITDHLAAVTRGQILKLAIMVPPGTSKPVEENQRVVEKVRGACRLAEISVGDFVLTHRGRFRRVLAVHQQGVLPLVNLRTWTGRSLLTAPDHPILTTRGWVEAGNVVVGDNLGAVVPQEEHGSATLLPEEARLLGYLVGDGSCTQSQLRVTNMDPWVLADVVYCAQRLGFKARVKKKTGQRASDVLLGCSSRRAGFGGFGVGGKGHYGQVRVWMERHGLWKKTSYTKRIPEAVLRGDRETLAQFLGAYWACDGFVTKKAAERPDVVVGCDTVSRALAEDVRHGLLRLGVMARVRTKVSRIRTAAQGVKYTSYTVPITTQAGVRRFAAVVGSKMRHSEKTQRLLGLESLLDFERVLLEDSVVGVEVVGEGVCRCLTVEEDGSFVASDLAVKNSSCVSVFWPTWEWTIDAAQRWLYQSYSDSLVLDHAVKARNVLGSDWFRARWPQVQLKDDQNQKSKFATTAGGYRVSTTVGGQALGLHPTRIVWDDPNARDTVGSPAERKFVNDSWDQTVSTRGIAVGVRKVLVMQRLEVEDAAGHILERETGWVQIVLPMRYEPRRMITTPLGWNDPRQEPGELLDPVRFPEEVVADLERTLGSWGTAGQLQQRPAPIGGGLIQRKHLRFWQPAGADLGPVRDPETGDGYFVADLPWDEVGGRRVYNLDQTIQTWDTSFKGDMSQVRRGQNTDPVSGLILGRRLAAIYLLDRMNKRMNGLDAAKAVVAMTRKWPEALVKLIEDRGNGPMMRDVLRAWGVVTQASDPSWGNKRQRVAEAAPDRKSKDARAMGMAAMVEAGEFYLPHPKLAPWVWDYLYQLTTFPASPHDDDVDATSQGFAYLQRFIQTALGDAAEAVYEVPPARTTDEIVRRQLKRLMDEEEQEAVAYEREQYTDGPSSPWLN